MIVSGVCTALHCTALPNTEARCIKTEKEWKEGRDQGRNSQDNNSMKGRKYPKIQHEKDMHTGLELNLLQNSFYYITTIKFYN